MSRFSVKLLVGIVVAVFFGIALYLRIALPYDQVFSGEWIKFSGNDPYYHMRLIDNLIHNFPRLTDFDPYFIYPGGAWVGSIRFFEWFLAGLIWVIGLGSPTEHTIDVVGVYFPAVLGALTVIPVYFIGKELFNRWAGVVSAGLIAIMPGEFLGRSILGFTDNHIAETLFTTVTMLFLILAVKTARQRKLSFGHLNRQHWAESARPLIYSLLAGIFLGIYLLTWIGALLFVFVISVYFIIQFIIDHLKHKSTDYLGVVGVILFFVALLMVLPVSPGRLYLTSLVIAVLIPPVLNGVSRLTARKIKVFYYPLALVGLGLAGLAIFYAISPSLLGSALDAFKIFVPSGVQLTTMEMQPFFFPAGGFSIVVAWGNFNSSFFLSLISLIIMVYVVIRYGEAEKSLLVVWSLVIFAATIGQRRFAYYYAVNVAVLTGYMSVLVYYAVRFTIDYLRNERTDYMSWQTLAFPEIKEEAQPLKPPIRAERKRAVRGKNSEAGFHLSNARISTILCLIFGVFFLVFLPYPLPYPEELAGLGWDSSLIGTSVATAEQARFAASDAWMSSLSWLKENTPEPFGNPDSYYGLYQPPPASENYTYPESAYGVMAWWDYGYWITRIAHRIPNANPSQDPSHVTEVARFFTSQDEDSVNEIMQKFGTAYIIVDFEAATSKFWAIATWAGKEQTEFFDVYYELQQDEQGQQFFYPRPYINSGFYRSLSTRLYIFDGKTVTPEKTTVISYQEVVSGEGILFKAIADKQEFTSYEQAEAYISSQESGDYEIVGDDPFVSPVPLEELKHYKLIYSSDEQVEQPDGGSIPAVKIFEYIK